eukprot:CAMPEP_0183734254 /NCGR_PEP_ID=MMETSP0737-20130205/43315_1 /TAXON_ID=385413 /ORGANISM="Thalassiosira miniscula, Strain CCMP1093" /LENGTH=817 /DNA_ID=CAMNT_0025967705 /DNA_START=10 /DNA_END=2463 /DNA_ORIENTATION=+
MTKKLFLFLFACCLPSLSLAWCSISSSSAGIRGIAGGAIGVGVASKQYESSSIKRINANHLQDSCSTSYANRLHLSQFNRKRNADRIRLWSVPNGGESQENDTDDKASTIEEVDAEGDKMTLEKASKLIPTFWSMAYPYFQESQPGRRLFYGMILLTLMNSGVSVAFSYISKDFWNALSSKDTAEFYSMMVKFGGALVVGAPVAVLYRFQREQLAVHWREWMTDRTLQLYNSNRVYYSLERDITGSAGAKETVFGENNGETDPINLLSPENDDASPAARIDNPDQRITEDVRTFTAFSLQLFITIVTSIIDLVSFSLILYSIQPQLFATIIGYAVFGTVMTTYIGRSLLPLNFEKLRREADLRYLLVRIRENAESIAFYGGEDVEGKEVASRLSQVVDNRRDINVAQRNLEFFTTAYHYLIQVVPVAVVAPQYFAGTIQLGVISQSVGAFNHILNDLTVIVNQFEQLSTFSAGIERLSTFMTAMARADPTRSIDDGLMSLSKEFNATDFVDVSAASDSVDVAAKEEPGLDGMIKLNVEGIPPAVANGGNVLLRTDKLGLLTPDRKRMLIDNLDLTVREGEHLLIVGASGAGKSSLLRAIAGLWTAGSGEITRVPDDEVYFLPQRPYCALGSLKDQLLYPSTESLNPEDYPEGHRLSRAHLLRQSMTDQDLLDVLDMVDLRELPYRFGDGDPIKGLNAVLDWSNTLSLGEQQRLAFGRLVVNQPRLVILDEATSALDVVSENKMYTLLKNMAQKELKRGVEDKVKLSRPGLTFISVGHRPTLLAYHDVKLRLNGGSDYSLEPLENSVSIPDINALQGL